MTLRTPPILIPWLHKFLTRIPDDDDFVSCSREEKMAEETAPGAVTRTHFTLVPLSSFEPHPLEVNHCVQLLQIDRFYGEFQLLDSADRVLGVSKQGRMSLLKKDLTTEVARVWHDALARSSVEYKFLHDLHGVEDPGLDLGGLQPLKIQFLHCPPDQEKFVHIPVCCRIPCIWHSQSYTFVDGETRNH